MLGIEARGFIFGPALAYRLNAGSVPVASPSKLPAETARITYALEYGQDTLEMHKDAIKPGQNVIIVDDLLATGGTAVATVNWWRTWAESGEPGIHRRTRLPQGTRRLRITTCEFAALQRVMSV